MSRRKPHERETQVAENLYAFAGALVGKFARRRRGEHWKEDAVQDLVLAGLQDYRNKRNIGLATHREDGQKTGLTVRNWRDTASSRRSTG